jgi:membrane-associated phospholipid phosphatase
MSNRARHVLATVAALMLAAFGTLAVLVARQAGVVDRPDRAIHGWLVAFGRVHPDWLSGWMVVTHFGDTLTLSLIDAALCGLCLVQRRWRVAAFVAVLSVGGWAVRIGVLNLSARTRPTDGFWAESGYAFPSGHTTNAAIMVCLLLIVAWPHLRRPGRRLAVAGAVTYAVAVGLSRVAGGVHWPSDVLGGLLLAVGLTCGAATVSSLLTRRSRPPGSVGLSPRSDAAAAGPTA